MEKHGLSVGHDHEPCKSGWTCRDDIWDVVSDEPKEPHIRLGLDTPQEGPCPCSPVARPLGRHVQ